MGEGTLERPFKQTARHFGSEALGMETEGRGSLIPYAAVQSEDTPLHSSSSTAPEENWIVVYASGGCGAGGGGGRGVVMNLGSIQIVVRTSRQENCAPDLKGHALG